MFSHSQSICLYPVARHVPLEMVRKPNESTNLQKSNEACLLQIKLPTMIESPLNKQAQESPHAANWPGRPEFCLSKLSAHQRQVLKLLLNSSSEIVVSASIRGRFILYNGRSLKIILPLSLVVATDAAGTKARSVIDQTPS